uniref:Uncharacterized protein n=1 Tax=Cyprinus carpio TaxID=7962 RepID=A0A8C1LQ94_CYPCA
MMSIFSCVCWLYECLLLRNIAKIFSHSVGCLFTLMVVSFAVQKLFSLMRSHFMVCSSICLCPLLFH